MGATLEKGRSRPNLTEIMFFLSKGKPQNSLSWAREKERYLYSLYICACEWDLSPVPMDKDMQDDRITVQSIQRTMEKEYKLEQLWIQTLSTCPVNSDNPPAPPSF